MRIRENELVQRIDRAFRHSGSAPAGVSLGIGDDAALFRPRIGYELVLTCDWFLEGTHCLREKHPASSVGWKCLARAVSDIAAMGGVPRCFLMSLALPASQAGRWLEDFLRGLRRASQKFQCALAGGDTTQRREILLNITVVGEAPVGRATLRSGARPGDVVYVSGRLGEAELGLRILRRTHGPADTAKNAFLKKHLYPEPRLALGQWLAKNRITTAMMDLSDGLSSDLPRLCAASGVGALLESAKIPQVKAAGLPHKQGLDSLQLALHGGDDYELLFTVPPRRAKSVPRSFRGLLLTPIGRITRESRLILRQENGREQPLVAGGWDPFWTRR